MEANRTEKKVNDFLTIRNAANEFPFSESALRHMIFLNKGGFSEKVVIKIGKKILLKRQEMINFLYNNSIGGNNE